MDAPVTRPPVALRRLRGGPLLRLRSDEQLLALFRAGSEDAFAVLHDRYRPRLFTYTRQMLGGSPTDAEDALQDVFLRAYHALRADDRPVSVRAWLYRVAHNRCIDHIRRAKPTPLDIDDPTRPETATASGDPALQDPVVVASRREELATLVTDVGRLPEQQRSALLLREMEGLSYAELAVALECSVPAVKSLLVRARMGLVEQAEARALHCSDIRDDLDDAHDRGVRMPGRARRHIRDCGACAAYRSTLKGVSTELGGLMPDPGPWAFWAKLASLGGAGSTAAAAAGGGAAAGGAAAGGGIALVGGGAAATASKVAAIVCCAAVVGGGAVEVQDRLVPKASAPAERAARPAPRVAEEAPVVRSARVQPAVVVPAGAAGTAGATAERPGTRARDRAKADEASVVALPPADPRSTPLAPPAGAPAVHPDVAAAHGAGSLLAPDEPVVLSTDGSPDTGRPDATPSSPTAPSSGGDAGTGDGAGTPPGSGPETPTGTGSSADEPAAAPAATPRLPEAGVPAPGPGGTAPAG